MRAFLLWVARGGLSRLLLGYFFTYGAWLMPGKRLYETDSLMAFYHPQPSYRFHVLLVPKRPWTTLTAVDKDDPFWTELLTAVQQLVQQFELTSYRLICNNGAPVQDVPHLHFHLVSDSAELDYEKTRP